MKAKEIRLLTGLTQAKFAEKYHIPKRTIESWEMESENGRKCNDYILELLEFKVRSDLKSGK